VIRGRSQWSTFSEAYKPCASRKSFVRLQNCCLLAVVGTC